MLNRSIGTAARICAAVLVVSLAGCGGPVSVATEMVGRAVSNRSSEELAKDIVRELTGDSQRRFGNLKVAVSQARDWRSLYTLRFEVSATGSLPSADDKKDAFAIIYRVLDAGPEDVVINDHISLVAR